MLYSNSMSVLSHFILIFSLVLGALAIYQLAQLRSEFNFRLITPYIHVLLGINFISLAHVVETLLKMIFPPVNFPDAILHVFSGIVIALNLVRLWVPLKLFLFFHLLSGRKWPKHISIAGYFLMFFMVTANLFTLRDAALYRTFSFWLISVTHVFFSVFIIVACTLSWKWSRSISFRPLKSTLLKTSFFLGSYALLVFAIRIMSRLGAFDPRVEMLLLSILALVFNMLHLFYSIKTVSVIRWAKPNADVEQQAKLLAERHRITEREMEIISLICQGKTNKEIADDLDITAYTVRDHCSNIFRKTGVKNRTQLTGLFSVAPPAQ